MYLTINFADLIHELCCSYLKTLIQNQTLNDKLVSFRNNVGLYRDFCNNSDFIGYEKVIY